MSRDVRDIDLFTGGTSELPVRGGAVGPTFACIIASQFWTLKFGDRFFYEHTGQAGSFTNSTVPPVLSSLSCSFFPVFNSSSIFFMAKFFSQSLLESLRFSVFEELMVAIFHLKSTTLRDKEEAKDVIRQIHELNKMTLAKIVCQVFKVKSLPQHLMVSDSKEGFPTLREFSSRQGLLEHFSVPCRGNT
ncbi:hypothetical protein LAZ67_2006377 [Cordylochernes scorpioides]|uniref:Uncharacterized protein n=1 Tax=Cordylochernes scorpioides TaxID=51811 RepID=A0ABY6K8L1_9ARAC|nr:hypothetical protein LAZ67_2006377 [Cordylochernes scorpioides]